VSQVELWREFQKWGRVREVFIPNKRNKYGKRFGFVRFLDVKDPKSLETKLDNIKMNETKLHVNLPRFARQDEKDKTASIEKREVWKTPPQN
jgi:hypothetical protein